MMLNSPPSIKNYSILLLVSFLEISSSLQKTNRTALRNFYQQDSQQYCGYYDSSPRSGIAFGGQTRQWDKDRISSGYEAPEGLFPSYVQFQAMGWFGYTSCGGTLITSRHVLTAAHCVEGKGSVTVFNSIRGLNDHRAEKIGSERICPSSRFNSYGNLAHDVAIIKLSRSFTNSRPACLPLAELSYNEPAWTVGLGLTGSFSSDPQVLQMLTVNRVPCGFGDWHPSKMCFKSNRSPGTVCSGDSGGPVYAFINGKQTVFGVTSYGHVDGCPPAALEAVFTNVLNVKWEIYNLVEQCS